MKNEGNVLENQKLVVDGLQKDIKQRILEYVSWLNDNNYHWLEADLSQYVVHLLEKRKPKPLSNESVRAHIGSIRSRYRSLLGEIDEFAPSTLDESEFGSWRLETQLKIRSTMYSDNLDKFDIPDWRSVSTENRFRLSFEQANKLVSSPGLGTLKGLRDTAIISLLLLGLREIEIIALDVSDIFYKGAFEDYLGTSANLAVHVKSAGIHPERVIPYTNLEWVQAIQECWLKVSRLSEGPLFRGLFKGNYKLRREQMTVRSLTNIMQSYPVVIDDKEEYTTTYNLRCTFARRLFDVGADIEMIQLYLGCTDILSTERLIGEMYVEQMKNGWDNKRHPYDYDKAQLANCYSR